ncbi:hypothetical protein Tco_1014725 [Tanacetum coccineum]
MAEQDTPPPTITAMKIPIIRKGESRRRTCTNRRSIWSSAPPAPKTAKQLIARRNQERVKSILLLAIPDEYLLKFQNVAYAKSLWEAIKSRFGGNVESKKMQKNVLKHQFEIFSTASNESLEKAYDRFQKLISQLEVHGAPISKEDINQKFLRSLPSLWNQIALIMRNKPDIDEIDIDDLYNNLRVYEDELKSTASGDFRVSTAGGINQVPCLDEFSIRKKIIELQTTELNTKTSETACQTNAEKLKSTSESVVSNPKIDRDRVIIDDWNSDDEEEEYKVQTVKPKTQTVQTRDDKSGLSRTSVSTARPVCTARPSVSTARPVCTAKPSVSTARPVCTAKPNFSTARPVYITRPIYLRMDNVRPRGSCLPIKRSYYTKLAFRPKDLKQDVNTFGVKNMTTAGTRAVVNTSKGKLNTDIKKSRWVWRPKGNYLDHVSKDSGTFMLKKDHAMVDSGCSSHMIGNKAYLSYYEDFNGGFVAFGSDPKGGKIMGKGKIKTANLDFDDV